MNKIKYVGCIQTEIHQYILESNPIFEKILDDINNLLENVTSNTTWISDVVTNTIYEKLWDATDEELVTIWNKIIPDVSMEEVIKMYDKFYRNMYDNDEYEKFNPYDENFSDGIGAVAEIRKRHTSPTQDKNNTKTRSPKKQ